jgi:hypothetical protein
MNRVPHSFAAFANGWVWSHLECAAITVKFEPSGNLVLA